jgi:hypothetical protein
MCFYAFSPGGNVKRFVSGGGEALVAVFLVKTAYITARTHALSKAWIVSILNTKK